MLLRGPDVVVSSCDDDGVYSSVDVCRQGTGHDDEKREVKTRQGVKLPLFEEQESAFWGVGVYYY